MQARQKRALAAFRRVQGFLDARGTELGGVNETGVRRTIDEVVVSLESLKSLQDPTKFHRTADLERVRAAKEVVRTDWMRPIAKIASTMLREVPEFSRLRLPTQRVVAVGLVDVGREMATAAEMHADVFIEAALPADFVATFRTKIDELQAAIALAEDGRRTRLGATNALASEARRGLKAVAVIDALLRGKIRGNEVLEGEWASTRRIVSRSVPADGGSGDGDGTTPATGPAAVPPVPTVSTVPTVSVSGQAGAIALQSVAQAE
jgi:hypothetical protein